MQRPYEAMSLRRRYIWSACQRTRADAFWPGVKDTREDRANSHATIVFAGRNAACFRRGRHATQTWWAGQRFFRIDHFRMKDLRP